MQSVFERRTLSQYDMNNIIKTLEEENQAATASFPDFKAGDTVNVHVKIKEGNKERIQQFQGTVIQRRHPGTNGETFTVRKVSNGIGIERIFPILSPNLDKIELNLIHIDLKPDLFQPY